LESSAPTTRLASRYLGFRVQGTGFRVQGQISGSEFRVEGQVFAELCSNDDSKHQTPGGGGLTSNSSPQTPELKGNLHMIHTVVLYECLYSHSTQPKVQTQVLDLRWNRLRSPAPFLTAQTPNSRHQTSNTKHHKRLVGWLVGWLVGNIN